MRRIRDAWTSVRFSTSLDEGRSTRSIVEAGAGLNGSFLSEGLVDEIVLYTAPCLFGSGMPVASVPLPEEPGLAHRWTIEDFTQIGADLRVILRR